MAAERGEIEYLWRMHPRRLRRTLGALALLVAPALACDDVGASIDALFFRIGLVVCGTLGALGLWAVIATIRGPRLGIGALIASVLLGGFIVVMTGLATEGFDPWPGTVTTDAVILMWLAQPLGCVAVVAAARFAADRVARPRRAWYVAGGVLAAYVGVLLRVSARVVAPPLAGSVVEVAVADEHGYARTDAGELVVLPGLALPGRYRAVRAGAGLALAIDEQGQVLRLDGWQQPVLLPVAGPVRDVAIAGTRACVVDVGGAVHCLDAALTDDPAPALRIVPGLVDVTDVEVGGERTCAIDRQTRVTCSGPREAGTDQPRPLGEPGARGLAVTRTSVCVLAAAGTVACAGEDELGALGDALLPVPQLVDVVEIVAGSDHLCARVGAGDVRCWSGNGWNQLGHAPDRGRDELVRIELPAAAASLVAQRNATCATLVDGRIYCWGAQRRPGNVFNGEKCGPLLGPKSECMDAPVEIDLPTDSIPFRAQR